MIRITYTSEAASILTSDEVFRIIETSAKNNMRDDLTGFLVFSGNRFFQYVEGPEDAIDALLEKLEDDRRHDSIRILDRAEIEERVFPRWKMKRLMPGSDWQSLAQTGPEFGKAPPAVKSAVMQFLETPSPARAAR